jgi:predicted nucleic acid-binding protein
MILADTSIWIDYLRQGEPLLTEQLSCGQVLMHGMVLGELAMGNFNIKEI